jgi:adenylyltransferase/sulfurtransferase
VDVWHNTFQRTELAGPSADCPTCVGGRYEYLHAERGAGATTLCGRDAVQVRPSQPLQAPLEEVAARLRPLGHVRVGRGLLHAALDGYELTVFPDGRAIVKGTGDAALARSLYARYLGS